MTLMGSAPARRSIIGGASLVGLMGVYIAVLYYVMIHFIAPTYTYLGYTYASPDPLRNAIVIAFAVGLGLLMPRRLDRASSFVLWVHFLIATVPSMLVPQFTAQLAQPLAFRFGCAVGVAWLGLLVATSARTTTLTARFARRLRGTSPRHRPRASRSIRMGPRQWTLVLAVVSLLVDVSLVTVFGLSGKLVSLTDVRDVRLAYREAIALAPPGTAYLLLFASNVLNPLIMMRGLIERRWLLVTVGLAGQVFIYATTGYKMVVLSVVAVLALYVWLHRSRATQSIVFLASITGLMTGAWAASVVLKGSVLPFLLFMRVFIAPGNLSAAYVSIFHDRDPQYWSYSFLGAFVDYPYPLTPNFLVGALFHGRSEVSANVNLFGDGYMSMRWGGIAIECLVLLGLLLVLDRVTRHTSMAEIAAALVLPTFALCNSNIFTSLTTHGLLAATVVLALVPSAVPATSPAQHRLPLWAPRRWSRRTAVRHRRRVRGSVRAGEQSQEGS